MEGGLELFGRDHVCALAATGAAGLLCLLLARRNAARASRSLRWPLAAALAGAHVLEAAVALSQGWYERAMLPLQLCDIAAMLAVYSLLTLELRAVEPLYFFALAGTLPALLTPELDVGFPHIRFVVYFLEHGLTVLAPLLLVFGLGIRLRRRAWLRAVLQVDALAMLAALANAMLGTNFMYLNAKPAGPTPFDLFGPWPSYLFVLQLLVLVLFRLLQAGGAKNGRRPTTAAGSLEWTSAGSVHPQGCPHSERMRAGMHFVVVGNGVCGMEAALALRAREASARISIVSDEYDHFFSRPALMYVFAGQLRLRDTEPYDRGLYERMGFERVRRRVASVSPGEKQISFTDGSRLSYDRLLLAVGSRARPSPWPGAEGSGVHAFVTLRDLEALDGEAKEGDRAVVIGGGLIGVEVAEILRHRGLHVSFVVRERWYFPLALEEREAALVGEHMGRHGVDVRLGVNVQCIVRDAVGRPRAVRLESGDEIPCDLVVSAIGVVPNTAFLEGSAVELSKGGAVQVDDGLRTSAPDVWAAGDCANVTWADGSRRPEQLWYTARDQGRAVAGSMLGDEVAYRRGTWYNSAKFFDLEWTTAGWVPALLSWDNTPVDPGPEVGFWFQRVPGAFVSQRIVTKGDRVVGLNLLGSRWDHEPLLGWIRERRSLKFVLEHLHEAQFDEEFTPRFRVLPSATWAMARG